MATMKVAKPVNQLFKSKKTTPFLGWSSEKIKCYKSILEKISVSDFKLSKIQAFGDARLLDELREATKVKFSTKWHKQSAVQIVNSTATEFTDSTNQTVAYTAGGLSALLKAFELLHNRSEMKVVFSSDSHLSIMDRSGLQAHQHPTQYDEYTLSDLIKALSFNFIDSRDPEKSNYQSFSIPMLNPSTSKLISYTNFFLEFLQQKGMAGFDVTQRSKLVVEGQKLSLENFSYIDYLTRASLNKSIMERKGRLYFGFPEDLPRLKHGLNSWKMLGIESYFVDDAFLKDRTLFDIENQPVHAYFIPGDGFFYPDIMEVIIEYLQLHYPDKFEYRANTKLASVYINPGSETAVAVKEITPDGSDRYSSINSIYCSLGHDQVFRNGQAIYKETLATSTTGDWVQHIHVDDLKSRLTNNMTIEEYLNNSEYNLPYADKFNLHVTRLGYKKSSIQDWYDIFYRVTEGGVLNYQTGLGSKNEKRGHSVLEKKDVINKLYKLNKTQLGIWKPITEGSCSRKIDKNNTRTNHSVASNAIFSINASGTGVVDAAKHIKLQK
ncbi:hypothetical protein TrispH2_010637 [Trichoplax sp. H2]|nr:hypothetical protein TrispH2_010637 [Trichoplax sp. H2]|eukprot:RDD38813.1 hypothetical protein TrispH2_010637 [Trichoplax sp. H2]